ncbi:Conserved_hypothetical protein [Hexamita inflata]|uniref:Transmembrane protein n=1 Tax=Hexamita inflata TaxID=28002 RepID=A0AA86V1J6_9EUKA|nr:Conserved hypothetical protein [Hexamita inflata]
MMIALLSLQTITTNLYLTEEPIGSYPYIRVDIPNCYQTTNVLQVDLSTNTMCLQLQRQEGSDCSQFPSGILYDISFDNQASWRTQQTDFSYFGTDKFCFPCYNNDCAFIQATTMAFAIIKSPTKQTNVPVGAIIILKSNQSSCYDTSVSSLRKNANSKVLKLYPLPACAYVFSDCQMSNIQEQKYSSHLIGTDTTPISSTDWATIKVMASDSFGSFYRIVKSQTQNLQEDHLYSVFTISYICPLITMQHTVKINYIGSVDYPTDVIGTKASTILQNDYFSFSQLTANPVLQSATYSTITVIAQFTNTKSSVILNSIQFEMNKFNFIKTYLKCTDAKSVMFDDSTSIQDQCKKILNYAMKNKDVTTVMFTFKFNEIFAVTLVKSVALSTGCHQSANLVYTDTQVDVRAVQLDGVTCALVREQKSTVTLSLFDNGIITPVVSKVMYYSSAGNLDIQLDCNNACQNTIIAHNVLYSIQSLETTGYSEILIEYVSTKSEKSDDQLLIIMGVSIALVCITVIVIELILKLMTQIKSKRSKVLRIRNIEQEDIE